MTLPDGRSVSREEQALIDGGVILTYGTDLNDPTGSYTLRFEGKTGEIQCSVYVETESCLFEYWKKNKDDEYWSKSKLTLYNFEPNERVRLFAYNRGGTFVAWQEFRVSSDGQLTIHITGESKEYSYAVVGDISGEGKTLEVYPDWGMYPVFRHSILPDSDANYVVADTGDDMPTVRSGPGHTYCVIGEVVSGEPIQIIGEAQETDGELWWPVRLVFRNGLEGWVIDTHILPAYVVANTGHDHLNVREGPGLNYHIIKRVVSGTRMRLIGMGWSSGEQDQFWSGAWWWRVRLDDGTEGWVPDGQANRIPD